MRHSLDGFEETIKREITKRNQDDEALLEQRMESRMAVLDDRLDRRIGAMERGIRELVAEVKKMNKPQIAKPNPPLEQRMESRMTAMERGMGEILAEMRKPERNRYNEAISTIFPRLLEKVAKGLEFLLLVLVIAGVGAVAAGLHSLLLAFVVTASRAACAAL